MMTQILDSGNRITYDSGAVRDISEGKGRCDLMPIKQVGEVLNDEVLLAIAKKDYVKAIHNFIDIEGVNQYELMLDVAKHFEQGAKKYGVDNWKKGIPSSSYIDSAIRHYLKRRAGYMDEPHDRAFVWNILCLMWNESPGTLAEAYKKISNSKEVKAINSGGDWNGTV